MDILYTEKYDKYDPSSIEAYAKRLIGHSFRDVLIADSERTRDEAQTSYDAPAHEQTLEYYESKAAKGSLGHLLEEHFFHYPINSDSDPDFKEAGVELKVTPFKENKNGSLSAKERLVLTIIDYMSVTDETFESSHLFNKCKLMLLIYYMHSNNSDKLDFQIKYADLFQIPPEDMKIIQDDFNFIVNKIKAGKAHELSEGDTCYLGASTKGATAAKSQRQQPFSDTPAKQRAFCFKTSYMTYILNNYIIPGHKTYERINFSGNFEKHILDTINQNTGTILSELLTKYDIHYTGKRPKNLESSLVLRMLGVKTDMAEEFVKAGIVVKTIRLEPNDSLRETVSFPAFDFIELVNETWEDSDIHNYLLETKFLFVVFKKDMEYEYFKKIKDHSGMDNHLYLDFAAFWNMPVDDIEQDVYSVWNKTRQVISEGIQTEQHGSRTFNNLPASKDNRVCHIRPHAKNKDDVLPLPNGGSFTKQSFFLNNTYVRDEILKLRK